MPPRSLSMGLIDGRYSRDAVDRSAAQWVAAEGDPGIEDQRAWEALTTPVRVDSRHGLDGDLPRPLDEVREWLRELRR
jgi:hypothetical protein